MKIGKWNLFSNFHFQIENEKWKSPSDFRFPFSNQNRKSELWNSTRTCIKPQLPFPFQFHKRKSEIAPFLHFSTLRANRKSEIGNHWVISDFWFPITPLQVHPRAKKMEQSARPRRQKRCFYKGQILTWARIFVVMLNIRNILGCLKRGHISLPDNVTSMTIYWQIKKKWQVLF